MRKTTNSGSLPKIKTIKIINKSRNREKNTMEKQNRNRSRQIIFRVTEDEYRIIRRKMIMSRMSNREAFIRKMLIEGVIVNVDTEQLEDIFYEMHKIGVNINQIAKVANTTGTISNQEFEELKGNVDDIWHILESFQSELQ